MGHGQVASNSIPPVLLFPGLLSSQRRSRGPWVPLAHLFLFLSILVSKCQFKSVPLRACPLSLWLKWRAPAAAEAGAPRRGPSSLRGLPGSSMLLPHFTLGWRGVDSQKG